MDGSSSSQVVTIPANGPPFKPPTDSPAEGEEPGPTEASSSPAIYDAGQPASPSEPTAAAQSFNLAHQPFDALDLDNSAILLDNSIPGPSAPLPTRKSAVTKVTPVRLRDYEGNVAWKSSISRSSSLESFGYVCYSVAYDKFSSSL